MCVDCLNKAVRNTIIIFVNVIVFMESFWGSAQYRKMIHYETGEWPSPEGRYEFKSNWYFFGGDNVLNSRDSRYFGLVPEDYIIGVVCKRRISD